MGNSTDMTMGHGGKREGSGRKARPSRRLLVEIDPELWVALDQHCRAVGMSKRETVEQAIRDVIAVM